MIKRGTVITIRPGDRLDATEPMELLLTEVPRELHPMQEWAHIEGVELGADGATADLPVRVVVRAALLRELDDE